ncbi:MAG: methyltransferase domain-containing protein [Planctomycetes bacterium]|nr:methyltransferase domain-containing protein [Planctomycetota bacterium]
MTGRACRLCGGRLSADDLLLAGVPAGAQAFADSAECAMTARTDLRIAACDGCGLVQSVSPPPPTFRQVITAAGLSPAMRNHRRQRLAAFVDRYGLAGKRCIEVGCGRGEMLALLAEAGVDPTGIEAGGEGRTGDGHPIVDAYPGQEAMLPGAPYAAFVCLNFLEHAPAPRAFLASINDAIGHQGCGLLEVPNFAQRQRHGRSFDYVADHVSYFDPETLETALRLAGFRVDRIDETRDGETIEAWVGKRAQPDFTADRKRIAEARLAVAEAMQSAGRRGGRLAIWGASHQALTLLAGLDGRDLLGVFDSAPFKQGRYAPASGLPILVPSTAAVAGATEILIIASGYEQEIARQLRARYGFGGRILSLSRGRVVAFEPAECHP